MKYSVKHAIKAIVSLFTALVLFCAGAGTYAPEPGLTPTASAAYYSTVDLNVKTKVTKNSIKLSWDRYSGASSYTITVFPPEGGWDDYENITATTYTLTGLTPGERYGIWILPCEYSYGFSNPLCYSGDIDVYTTLPAPTGIKSEPELTSLTLTWNEVKYANAYRVYKYNASKGKFEQYKNVSGTSCSVTGLTKNTTYKFKIAALVKSGSKYSEQELSGAVSASTLAKEKLAAPTGIKASVTESTIKLSWNKVTGADAYRVYKYNSSSDSFEVYQNVSGNTCTVTGLSGSTKYRFKLAALVKDGSSYREQKVSSAVAASTSAKKETTTSSGGSSGSYSGGSSGIYSGGNTYIPSINNQPRKCAVCNGSGKCRICGGSGKASYFIGSSKYNYHPNCSSCRGSGNCKYCTGGYIY